MRHRFKVIDGGRAEAAPAPRWYEEVKCLFCEQATGVATTAFITVWLGPRMNDKGDLIVDSGHRILRCATCGTDLFHLTR